MFVQLGNRPRATFDQPLLLLEECHRRIERFLLTLANVAAAGPALESGSGPHRDALEGALGYFATAAPRHTEDEEVSLFPRMRRAAAAGDEARAVLDALEADHRKVEAGHARVDEIGRAWLAAGVLDASQLAELQALVAELQAAYAPHIAREDREVFPLAARLLTPDDLAAIGKEMAARRGLGPR